MEKCSSVRGRKEKTRNGTQKKKKLIVVFLFLFLFFFGFFCSFFSFFFLFFFHVFVVFYMFLHWRQATIRFSMHACIHAHILALFFEFDGRTMVLTFIFLSQIILLDECFFCFKFEIFIIEIDDISRKTDTHISIYLLMTREITFEWNEETRIDYLLS